MLSLNKKGLAAIVNVLVSLVLMLVIAMVVISKFTDTAHADVVQGVKESRNATSDQICLAVSSGSVIAQGFSGRYSSITPGADIDDDVRIDSCDWCVCKTGCHNDRDDRDGDKLPDICDREPNIKNRVESRNQFSDKCVIGVNLYEKKGGLQCVNPDG